MVRASSTGWSMVSGGWNIAATTVRACARSTMVEWFAAARRASSPTWSRCWRRKLDRLTPNLPLERRRVALLVALLDLREHVEDPVLARVALADADVLLLQTPAVRLANVPLERARFRLQRRAYAYIVRRLRARQIVLRRDDSTPRLHWAWLAS